MDTSSADFEDKICRNYENMIVKMRISKDDDNLVFFIVLTNNDVINNYLTFFNEVFRIKIDDLYQIINLYHSSFQSIAPEDYIINKLFNVDWDQIEWNVFYMPSNSSSHYVIDDFLGLSRTSIWFNIRNYFYNDVEKDILNIIHNNFKVFYNNFFMLFFSSNKFA